MKELYEAVKNLLSQKETYFERHPEAVEIAYSVSEKDPEYDAAWDRLETVFNNIAVGELTEGIVKREMVIDYTDYKGTLITQDKIYKPVGGIASNV